MRSRALIRNDALSKLLPNYSKEMQLLVIGGRLTKEEGWWNVVEHCLEQLVVADALTDLLKLQRLTKQNIMQAALCHDWDKRIEVRPEDFKKDDIKRARNVFQTIAPSRTLIFATKPGFMVQALIKQKSTFAQRLMYYVDSSTKNADIVGYRVRLNEARLNNPDPDKNPILTKKIGGKYWDKELELAQSIEKEIIAKLSIKGVKLKSGKNLPELIYGYLSAKYST